MWAWVPCGCTARSTFAAHALCPQDRLYLTTTEWKHEWGGFKDKTRLPFKRLPFHCCAIAFTPFEEPVCTDEGTVYDVANIVPYVLKVGGRARQGVARAGSLLELHRWGRNPARSQYHKHPVTGAPLALKDLVKLNWHKNSEGAFDCPVMGKVRRPRRWCLAGAGRRAWPGGAAGGPCDRWVKIAQITR